MGQRRKSTIVNPAPTPAVIRAARCPTRGGLLGATAMAALIGWGVLTFATPADAQLPTGGTVVGGSATITTGANQVTVNQTTNRGVIDWRSFSIGQGSRVDFRQPNASAVTLNRVTGPDPSVIAGQLTANGQIVLVNGAGILFANGAQVNVGALAASTATISNPQAFMAGGKITFDVPSPTANAGVVNEGTITVQDGGLVGLVGNMAANHGVINARLGRVTIGGAETFTVDLAGDGLINFQIGQPVTRQPVDGEGKKVPLASNTGTINADGGVVTMTARAAGGVVDNVVNVGGAIRAQAVSQEGGVLVLGGEDGGTVDVTGKLDVSGKSLGQRGGQVVATARGGKVNVAATAVIDASGASGGGRINIGGNYQGKGPLPNARDTRVEAGARINADATTQGNGGDVIVWSDNATVFGGTISAKGGLKGGDGGLVETSGKVDLSVLPSARVDTSAAFGGTGLWLLDPQNITITAADATTISGQLETTNVMLNTSGPGTDAGDITLNAGATISWTSANTLTLNADQNITINGTISATSAATGNRLILNAARTDPGGGISGGANSAINVGGGTLTVTAGTGSILLLQTLVRAGVFNFTVVGGGVEVNNPGNAIGTLATVPSGQTGAVFPSIVISSSTPLTIGAGGITAFQSVTITSSDLTVSGSITTAAGQLSLVAAGGILQTAGTISGADIALTANTGSIIQTGGNIAISPGQISIGRLEISAAGAVQLASTTNNVDRLVGAAGTDFRYVDADTLELGSPVGTGAVGGIGIGAGRYLDIAADGFTIRAGAQIGVVTATGADNPTGVIVLRPATAGTAMTIGGTSGTGLTEAALVTGIRTGTLRIGSIGRAAGTALGGATTATESAAGAITIQGLDLSAAAVQTLVLESGAAGAAITQSATDPLLVTALATATRADANVVLRGGALNNEIGTVAHVLRISDTEAGITTGLYSLDVRFGLTIGILGSATLPLVGLRSGGATPGLPANTAIVAGAVDLNTGPGGLLINNAIVTSGGNVTLTAFPGSITSTAEGIIDVGAGTLTMTAGGITLGAAPVTAGAVNFIADGGASIDNPGNAINALATAASSATGSPVSHVFISSSVPMTIGSGGLTVSGFTDIDSAGQLTVNGSIAGQNFVNLRGNGIVQTAGTIAGTSVFLTAGAGTSIIQVGGNITSSVGDLSARAGGAVQLTSATNNVVTVVGSAGTDFRYVDADTVVLGRDAQGITIGAGRYLDISADGIGIASGVLVGAMLAGESRVDNPTGVTVLRPTTAGTPAVIGGTGGTGLTQAALSAGIRTGTLRIGSIGRAAGTVLGGATIAGESAAGAITVQGLDFNGSGAAVRTLVIESAAGGTAISQTAPIVVNALATAVIGSGAVELTQDNSVGALAHVARISDSALGIQGGTYRYVDGSSIPVITVAGSGTPLIGQRDSGAAPGAPPRSAILTAGGDVTLVSRTGSIEFINGLAAVGATVRLSAADQIFQSATGGIVANALLAAAGGAIDLSTAAGLNNVRFLSGSAAGAGEAPGDFRLINAASVTVPAGGVGGDSLVATIAGVHAGVGATLELAIGTGDITVDNAALTATDGLVLLRRIAGATGSEIILNNVSFDTGSGSPNLVVLDLTGSPALSPGNFAALKSSMTPPSGTSAIAPGPNPDGGILLSNVNAGNTTVYLLGGPGATIAGSGTYGLLGVYVAHGNPIALTGSVRQIDPTTSHAVTAPFSEPFDATRFAGFYVRRQGAVVDIQTFNGCPIGGICPQLDVEIPPSVQRPPDNPGRFVGVPDRLQLDFVADRAVPTPLGLSTVILVNQGNEYFFNVDDEERRHRAARGGQ
ncbi:filamentous hemagglutinin N-terminal domain-containing protein [Reyranella sp. CPCC 100927]|uniref:beta strand repeat-containing protein n=1 Tax=Reyranella sp. CPCC 100927 TaxID=2599616 RepID=UPI0011B5180D|nr:filamentous hemagglutinin N-terminal domain-containing protein [Reyranella sp. CPCC 100927]TWT13021.1 filamentous hemagglutinin N-terminal domain-containing protein [Reyranella sp. CPCC 100927]